PADGARAREQAIELARERRDGNLLTLAQRGQVMPCDLLGEAEQALVHARRAVERAEASGSKWLRALALSALGHAYVANRRWHEAIEALTAVLAALRELHAPPLVESDSTALLADAPSGAGACAPFRHVARAPLAELAGDSAGRERELREAQRLFTEMGAPIRAEHMAPERA